MIVACLRVNGKYEADDLCDDLAAGVMDGEWTMEMGW